MTDGYRQYQRRAAATREAERARRRGDVDVDPDVALATKPARLVPCTFCQTPCVSIDPTPKCRACLGGN